MKKLPDQEVANLKKAIEQLKDPFKIEMNSDELRQMRFKVEDNQKWLDEIKVIPPFGDAVVRFLVRLPSGKERSVYLDNRHALGIYEGMEPYWEVYPHRDDTARCGIDEIDKLLEYIGDESE